MGKRVAIVGSGCSGIGALWALNTSTDHEVHLFEAASSLGGPANTVTFQGPRGREVHVDTGFMLMNSLTHPNFVHFLEELKVPTKKIQMTAGFSRDQGTFEWAGKSFSSVFVQKENLFSFGMWRLIFDVVRFNEFALDLLEEETDGRNKVTARRKEGTIDSTRETVSEYLDRNGYSAQFRNDYFIPLTAAIGSVSPNGSPLDFPAAALVRFMYDRHLLNAVTDHSDWLTIPGGSKQYVSAVMKDFPIDRVHLESKVHALTPTKRGSVILTANERDHHFDHVILATHGDEALAILRSVASRQEMEILGGFRTQRNVAVLHSDLSLMPKRRRAWSACNYLIESPFPPAKRKGVPRVSLTYQINLLQQLPEGEFGPVLVTLSPLHMPDPRFAQEIWEYSHPRYDTTAIRSQQLLPRIQNIRGISYCGVWTSSGLHEDGLSSGLSVAVNHLGAKLPFDFVELTSARREKPVLTTQNYLLRLAILLVQIYLLLLARAWYTVLRLVDRRLVLQRKAS